MLLSKMPSESESGLTLHRQNARRERTRFYRRKKSLFKSGYDLHNQCHAEVYILIRRNGRSYILSCAEAGKSPFSDQTLVSDAVYIRGHSRVLTLVQNQSYPIPRWSFPNDFRTS